MAEFITEMQERLLPEYEQLKQFEVCTEGEIRDCIRKRDSLFLKITKSQKSVRNYLELIDFEKSMHKLVTDKEASEGKKLAGLKASIAKRIIRLYREGLSKFAHDTDFWERFIRFSKLSVAHEVAGIYEKLLSYHGGKPRFWADAAIWAYEYAQNMSRVEDICERGLQRHPRSELIYKCLIDILLREALMMKDDPAEQELGLKKVEIVYKNSSKHIESLDFYLQLLKRLEENEYADITFNLKVRLLNDLQVKFEKTEAFWNLLAQRELRGLVTCDSLRSRLLAENSEDAVNVSKDASNQISLGSLEDRIERCVKVYIEATKVLPTERMWSLYIRAMLELNKDMTSLQNLRRKCIATAFKSAHESGFMSIEHYSAFAEMALKAPSGIQTVEAVLKTAIERRKSVELYELLVKVYANDLNDQMVEKTLQSAHKIFGAKSSLPVWREAMIFFNELGTPESRLKLLKLYQQASYETTAGFALLRAEYLKFVAEEKGKAAARRLYEELKQLSPQCLELHQAMLNIELELQQDTTKDLKYVRQCYENIAFYFGKTNPDVWLDLIKFECENGGAREVCRIYDRAKATLESEHVDNFIAKYSLRNF